MRSLLALAAAVPFGLGAGACGGTSNGTHTASRAAANVAASGAAPVSVAVAPTPDVRGLKGDEDDDESAGSQTGDTKNDNDADFDNDRANIGQTGYYDEDDNSVRAYGHAASVGDARALAAIVKRYFAAAAVGDGAGACSTLEPTIARSVPEAYGRAPGPVYLQGKTCAAVMSRLFEHIHAKLAGAVEVTGVRVQGERALVFVGSRTMSAIYLTVERKGGAWRIAGLFGTSLP
jgi:hypothetical protein